MKQHRTIIISEAGGTHQGDISIAKKMIHESAKAGADYIKFQSFLASEIPSNDPERKWFEQFELSDEAHFILKEEAERNNIKFLSSPFGLNRAKFLYEDLGLKEFKIASSELLNYPVLDYVGKNAEKIFLSTGMATINEIQEALDFSYRKKNIQYILHCVSSYPTISKEANLKNIDFLRDEFPFYPVGYSDHTIGIQAPLISASMGVDVIEKHFTLDKTQDGIDHTISVNPKELKMMIEKIRSIETYLGEYYRTLNDEENEWKKLVRSRFLNE